MYNKLVIQPHTPSKKTLDFSYNNMYQNTMRLCEGEEDCMGNLREPCDEGVEGRSGECVKSHMA